MALIAAYVIDEERKRKRNVRNSEQIILYFLLHDLEEGVIGDITYKFKQNPCLKYIYPVIAEKETLTQLGLIKLPEFSKFLKKSFLFEKSFDEETKELIDALERLEYLLYAFHRFLNQWNEKSRSL